MLIKYSGIVRLHIIIHLSNENQKNTAMSPIGLVLYQWIIILFFFILRIGKMYESINEFIHTLFILHLVNEQQKIVFI